MRKYVRKRKAASDIWKLAWYIPAWPSELGLAYSVEYNYTEHKHQTRPFCNRDGSRQNQDHSLIISARR